MPHNPDDPLDYVYLPVRRDLYLECIRRHNRWEDVNVARYVEHAFEGFLETTAGDVDIWTSDEYLDEYRDEQNRRTPLKEYGDESQGYRWKNLLLPNGTKIKMTYNGVDHFAEVRHEEIWHEEEKYSPSQLASTIANNTSRNAWRDLFVQRPRSRGWVLALVARQENPSKPTSRLRKVESAGRPEDDKAGEK